MSEENNDFDFYQPKKQSKINEPEPEQPTTIAGLEFKTGMRFTIEDLLFEVTGFNRIYCVESFLTCFDNLKNTVFDVTNERHGLFFDKTGLDMSKVKKCYSEPKNANYADVSKVINKLDFNYKPEGF